MKDLNAGASDQACFLLYKRLTINDTLLQRYSDHIKLFPYRNIPHPTPVIQDLIVLATDRGRWHLDSVDQIPPSYEKISINLNKNNSGRELYPFVAKKNVLLDGLNPSPNNTPSSSPAFSSVNNSSSNSNSSSSNNSNNTNSSTLWPITDISAIVTDDARGVPHGWSRIDRDCNFGSGGDKVYLIARREWGSTPIIDIDFIWADQKAPSKKLPAIRAGKVKEGYFVCPINLNSGTKGRGILITYKKETIKQNNEKGKEEKN